MANETPPPENRLTPRAYLRLILIAAAIGIPAAFVAALLLALVHDLEQWLWDDLPRHLDASSPPWYLVVGLPFVGACIVLAARKLLPGDGGHPPIEGLSSAPTPPSHAPGIVIAALGTLGFGAVLGPEMPVIALGSAVGTTVAPFVRLGRQETAVLSSAGSFSAISALFGGPIVAGTLLTEASVGLGAALAPTLLPGLVAAAIGYVIFVGLGDWGGLATPGLAVPDLPLYNGTHVLDLLVGCAVGIVTALVIVVVKRAAGAVQARQALLGLAGLLLLGGLAVGLVAEVADLLGADSQEILFSGQSSIPQLVGDDSTKIVLIVLAAKTIGYAVSLGCGFRGGPIFPAIFLSVGIATFPVIWFDMSPTVAVALGAAAGMAAQTRLLIAPVIFAALLVGAAGTDAIPAAVLASATAWLTMTALDRRGGSTAARLPPKRALKQPSAPPDRRRPQ